MYKISRTDFGKAHAGVSVFRNDTNCTVGVYDSDSKLIVNPTTDGDGKIDMYVPEKGAYDILVNGYRFYVTAGVEGGEGEAYAQVQKVTAPPPAGTPSNIISILLVQ